jgi:hypothetical protein
MMSLPKQKPTLTEQEARRLFRRCVWISFLPLLGLAAVLGLATVESSLPPATVKPISFIGLAAILGGDLWFCRILGQLAAGLGQSGPRWSHGAWIASKFLAFVAWWLALLKMRAILKRAYMREPIPFDGIFQSNPYVRFRSRQRPLWTNSTGRSGSWRDTRFDAGSEG